MPADTHRQEPITSPKSGAPPAWVVACLDCSYSVDEHGLTGEDAVQTVNPRHAGGTHRLIARAVDYTAHPLYRRHEPR